LLSHQTIKGTTMKQISYKNELKTQKQTKEQNNRKNNGQFNHYRFKEKLDRL